MKRFTVLQRVYGVCIFEMRGKHKVVSHGKDERGDERNGRILYAKTWMYHYRGVSKQYFHLYLKEIEFRFNNRDISLKC